MKNCTKHSVERWVERILGIKTIKERDEYIRDNLEQIKEHMNKTFDYSEFIYKGQIGDNITRNFYIKDDIILVLNTQDDAIITVYKVDFNFTPEINLQVAKELLKVVHKLTKEKEELEFKLLLEVESHQEKSDNLKEQIKIAEEQLKAMKEQKQSIDEYIKSTTNATKITELELRKHLNNLVNSKEYREDIKKP